MSLKDWENYIHNKFNFYARQGCQARADSEFPWLALTPKSLTGHLKQWPLLKDAHMRLKREEKWHAVASRIEQFYEARCLLDDDLSRLFYDEALIVRLVSQNRFFFPRTNFDMFAEVVSREPFNVVGYPNDYSGLPLEKYALTLTTANANICVVAASGFVDLLNKWRQYLITRGSVQFRPKPGGVVLDCGTCIGDMSVVFAGLVGPSGQVHGFDPIPLHNRFCALQTQLNPALSNILFFNQVAVGKNIQKVSGSKSDCDDISPGGLIIDDFNMTTLDGYAVDRKLGNIDFIKMDIEGAEGDALIGAENIIKECKPNLAISTYHRTDDFWSLPLQIKKINPTYKLAFEHHSPLLWESVIYAYE